MDRDRMVGMDIAWSAEFDFVVNNLAINHEVFQSSLRFGRGGFDVEIVVPRDQAHSYTALESVGDKTHWVSGFLMDLFTVKVTGPCPYDIDDEKDDQFDESDEADAKRREFLKRALVVAEAVSADFVECVRVEQPWLAACV
jgi:hypothetical protein